MLKIQMCTGQLLIGCWGPNSGPHVRVTSILLSKASPKSSEQAHVSRASPVQLHWSTGVHSLSGGQAQEEPSAQEETGAREEPAAQEPLRFSGSPCQLSV